MTDQYPDERGLDQDGDPRWPFTRHLNDAPLFLSHSSEQSLPQQAVTTTTSRIVRIHRDYVFASDSSTPAFRLDFPGYPLSVFVSRSEFHDIMLEINDRLQEAFAPGSWPNFMDNVIGFLTCWISESVYMSFHQRKLMELEHFVHQVNESILATRGVKIISPRLTGYLSLDIQVPYPFRSCLP
ncbi:Golgin subfamily A member 7/ERF4 family-domain-containing protein [Lipomyces japonicus]|uniref:Golgin subfamily A member 7/ERF4 family-domain-containing protein n=1 Tax=Lipomyces japonicus TaxID=56871 RepID=UPI0034CE9181